MPSASAQVNNQQIEERRVYYTGSIELQAGQPLCFQETVAGTTKGLGVDVELPNGDNSRVFAGIVAPSSVGISAPGWIRILVPKQGDILQVLVSNVSAVALNQMLKLNAELHTATATTNLDREGAFDAISPATVTTTEATAFANATKAQALALSTLAVSTGAGDFGRSLLWVQFQ